MPIDMTDRRLAFPKGERRQTTKRRQARQESRVKRDVRAACVQRDGYCAFWAIKRAHDIGEAPLEFISSLCDGDSEWAHMHQKRRSKTRGMDPEVRHTTADSLCLCRRHHAQYDGREEPRLKITRLTRRGADGPLRFSR